MEDDSVKLTAFRLSSEPDVGFYNEGHINRAFSTDQACGEECAMPTQVRSFQLIWRDITYLVRQDPYHRALNRLRSVFGTADGDLDPKDGANAGDRFIFKNLSGCIRSGEITAILGPSGTGKTSLLKAICGYRVSNIK